MADQELFRAYAKSVRNPYGTPQKREISTYQDSLKKVARSRGKHIDLARQLYLAGRLRYLNNHFQHFLPKNLQGQLHLASVGHQYWLVHAEHSAFAQNFRFHQEMVRNALEAHLNQISKREWRIPQFLVKTVRTKAMEQPFQFSKKEGTLPKEEQKRVENRVAMIRAMREELFGNQHE